MAAMLILSEYALSRALLLQEIQELQTCAIIRHFHGIRMDNSRTVPLRPYLTTSNTCQQLKKQHK